jgi:hypothetical protein
LGAFWGSVYILYEKERLTITDVALRYATSYVCEGCETVLWGSYGYHG